MPASAPQDKKKLHRQDRLCSFYRKNSFLVLGLNQLGPAGGIYAESDETESDK